MMARLIFVISIIFAWVVLRGWPAEASVWMRSLIALGAIVTGVAALVLARPAAKAHRFKSVRKMRAKDKLTGAACLAALLGLFYFTLVFAPPAARELSFYVVTVIQERLASGEPARDGDTGDRETEPTSNDSEFETGAMFDPNGAVVPKAANVSPSPEPAISLKFAGSAAAEQLRRSGRIYLHSFSHHVFDGERWTSEVGDGPLFLESNADGVVHLDKPAEKPDYAYTILHHKFSSGLDALTTLQGVRSVRLPEITQLNAGTWLLPRPENALGIIRPYQAASSPRWFDKLLADGAPLKPGVMEPAYLAPSKDESLNRKIREIAELFRLQSTTRQQLMALQHWLSESFGYTLQMDYPDKDKSALESFLSNPGSGEGFCVHFASAAVLILRELGVPARVSYGWTGGEFYPEQHQFVFRAEDGHAWAEIYLEGQGWVVFETTPGSGLPPSYAAIPGTVPPKVETIEEDERTSARDQTRGVPAWLWMLLLIAGGGAFLFVLAKWRQLAAEGGDFEEGAAPMPPGYLQLFYRRGAGLGHPKPLGSTLNEYLEHLQRENISVPFAKELLTYHYQVTYREGERSHEVERQLRRQIKAL